MLHFLPNPRQNLTNLFYASLNKLFTEIGKPSNRLNLHEALRDGGRGLGRLI